MELKRLEPAFELQLRLVRQNGGAMPQHLKRDLRMPGPPRVQRELGRAPKLSLPSVRIARIDRECGLKLIHRLGIAVSGKQLVAGDDLGRARDRIGCRRARRRPRLRGAGLQGEESRRRERQAAQTAGK